MTEKEVYEYWEKVKKDFPVLASCSLHINRRLKRRAGQAWKYKRRIEVAGWLLDNAPDEEVIDTLLHEAAHMFSRGHSSTWKRWAKKLGANPTRCYPKTLDQFRSTAPYQITCSKCDKSWDRYRRSNLSGRYHVPCGRDSRLSFSKTTKLLSI